MADDTVFKTSARAARAAEAAWFSVALEYSATSVVWLAVARAASAAETVCVAVAQAYSAAEALCVRVARAYIAADAVNPSDGFCSGARPSGATPSLKCRARMAAEME